MVARLPTILWKRSPRPRSGSGAVQTERTLWYTKPLFPLCPSLPLALDPLQAVHSELVLLRHSKERIQFREKAGEPGTDKDR